MTHRQTETSKEIRLWISQVIIPVGAILGTVFLTVPEAGQKVKEVAAKGKRKIKNVINKW